MAQVEWKNRLRIVVGEITRKQQMQIWQQITDEGIGLLDPIPQNETIMEILAAAATRAVYVRDGKSWRLAEDTVTVQDEDMDFAFTLPVQRGTFSDLPMSLSNQWLGSAREANGGLEMLLNFTWTTLADSTNGSAPEPDSEA